MPKLHHVTVKLNFLAGSQLLSLRRMRVIGDAERHEIVVGENETGATLLRCATDAAPIVVAISSV